MKIIYEVNYIYIFYIYIFLSGLKFFIYFGFFFNY